MTKMIKISVLIALFLLPVITLGAGGKEASFSPYVDDRGNISLPRDFRTTWSHLGTWALTSKAAAGPHVMKASPGTGLHEVYTQPESAKAYKKTGKWPDGAVLIMEVRTIEWDDMATGHVMYAGETTESLMMVKDGKVRFKDNPNWGAGWGWAVFKTADPKKNLSKSYKSDCMGCHEPKKSTDWVHINGYPTLR